MVNNSRIVRDALAICQDICALIKRSPKRQAILEELKVIADDTNALKITSFCPTRYTTIISLCTQLLKIVVVKKPKVFL